MIVEFLTSAPRTTKTTVFDKTPPLSFDRNIKSGSGVRYEGFDNFVWKIRDEIVFLIQRMQKEGFFKHFLKSELFNCLTIKTRNKKCMSNAEKRDKHEKISKTLF